MKEALITGGKTEMKSLRIDPLIDSSHSGYRDQAISKKINSLFCVYP